MFAHYLSDHATFLEPRIPRSALATVARELDRHAATALRGGRVLVASKATRRAAELRKAATAR